MEQEEYNRRLEVKIKNSFIGNGVSVEVELINTLGYETETQVSIIIQEVKQFMYNPYYDQLLNFTGEFADGELDRYLKILRGVWR